MPTNPNIQDEANRHYASRFDDELRELIGIVDEYGSGYDEAIERLQEMPLSFDKLVTDHRHEEIQWEILLGTGGPADRVLVTTDFQGHIETAEYQFQDWFTPWTAAE